MQFNSLAFAMFMVAVLPVYFALGRWRQLRLQNLFVLVASYCFYGWWDWRFLGLLAVSTILDYSIGCAMQRSLAKSNADRAPKWMLVTSLVVNLGILGFFKYWNFFIESASVALGELGLEANLPLLKVILPVGISFYTFQTIAYTYSVYRRRVQATTDFVAFAVYVAYFPQLVAGPIENAKRLLPQILAPRVVTSSGFASGCQLVLLGLFKKIAIADAAAVYVERVFDNPGAASSGSLLLGVYMFALQIYGDFSGYTDIARGVSRCMGIELILNFRQPYLASNITEFWRRWHISLSTWLREHLYIPLGGNRNGTWRTYRNLMITMLLGGLWHGAGWTFVIWGGLHGCYLAIHKFLLSRRSTADSQASGSAVSHLVGVLVTFHLVCLAWVFFRSDTLETALQVIAGMLAWNSDATSLVPLQSLWLLGLMVVLDYACVRHESGGSIRSSNSLLSQTFVYGVALVLIVLANSPGDVPFIYFQF